MASSSRAVITLAGTAVLALAAIGLAIAAPGSGAAARTELSAASGAVHIANSRAGRAVLNAAGARPGETVTGSVTIGNDGDVSGRFVLAGTGVTETAGVHGGLLSEGVRLVVVDVTDSPVTVYAGEAVELDRAPLGVLGPGEEREYVVAATLPDGGAPVSATAGDNRFQGASLSFGLAWQASPVVVATPTPTPAPAAPAPAPTPMPPTPTPAPPALGTLGLTATCVKAGRLTLKLKAPEGTTVLSATVSGNGRVIARLKAAQARKPVALQGLRGSRAKVSVSAKASDGRTYTAARTFRACR